MELAGGEVRHWFGTAARGLVAAVAQVGEHDWARPALGEWDVRALVGHTSRSFLTVESYLDVGAARAGDAGAPAEALISVVEYYVRGREVAAGPGVAERGWVAGAALGDDPAAAVGEIARRVEELVGSSPDDALVRSPLGAMRLIDYLQTRAFELTVHGLDLVHALHRPVPSAMHDSVGPALALAARLTVDAGGGEALLMQLTGRPVLGELPQIV